MWLDRDTSDSGNNFIAVDQTSTSTVKRPNTNEPAPRSTPYRMVAKIENLKLLFIEGKPFQSILPTEIGLYTFSRDREPFVLHP